MLVHIYIYIYMTAELESLLALDKVNAHLKFDKSHLVCALNKLEAC